MPLFDAYILVDWSAASGRNVGKDSIWVAEGYRDGHGFHVWEPLNPPFRAETTQHLTDRLLVHLGHGRRVLIGFDFPYGYPYGFALTLGLGDAQDQWRCIWQYLNAHIVDGIDNGNNRFQLAAEINHQLGAQPGPFWGRPWQHVIADLPQQNTVDYPYDAHGTLLGEFRRTEQFLIAHRHIRPSSAWKLCYQPTVGSQALLGIPRLEQLYGHQELHQHSLVWPFETGWTVPSLRPLILHAEIYPSAVDIDHGLHLIPDAAQVLTLLNRARELDDRDELAACFARPQHLNADQERQVLDAEGWILWA